MLWIICDNFRWKLISKCYADLDCHSGQRLSLSNSCLCSMFKVMKTGESGLTVFRLLTKENQWKWVQANARLVYKNGKPDYIIATQRPLL